MFYGSYYTLGKSKTALDAKFDIQLFVYTTGASGYPTIVTKVATESPAPELAHDDRH